MFLSWFRSEVLVPRRLFFNVFFYGIQLTLFALGWYLQVCPHLNLITGFSFSHSQVTNARLAALNELKYSVWVSRGAGLALAFDGGLLLIPMLRNVIRILRPTLTRIFPADANVWFHRQVAYSMAFWAMVHTTAHYVNFFNVERARKYDYVHDLTNVFKCHTRNPSRDCTYHSLRSSRRYHRPFYAIDYAADIYNRSSQNPPAVL